MKARFLGFLAAFVTVSTWAQGTIYFATRIANGVNAPLEFGTGLGPGPAWSAALYLVDSPNSLSLIPGSLTKFGDGTSNPLLAKYIEPVTLEVPGAPIGSSVTVRMRAWLTEEGAYETAIYRSESPDLFIPSLGGGSVPSAELPASFTGFIVLVPEPSTSAIAAAGALLLLAFRRRSRQTLRALFAAFLLFGANCSWAQGTINFNNRVPEAGVFAPIFVLQPAFSPPGSDYLAALYLVSPDGSATIIPDSITTFYDGAQNLEASSYIIPRIAEVPNAPPGSSVTVKMRVWRVGGSHGGDSDVLSIPSLGGNGAPPANLPASFTGFMFTIPEPSTYVLGAFGAAILFIFRRDPSR